MKRKTIPEAQIAWVLCTVLEEITERLWLRYGEDFIRLERKQEEEEIQKEDGAKKKNPDPSTQEDF